MDKQKESPNKSEVLLTNKRERSLKDNWLSRRNNIQKQLGLYEKNSNLYYNMLAFNWDEEKLSKTRINPCKFEF